VEKLNLMTENWVCSKQMMEAAKASNVKTKLRVLPYATDTSKYSKSYKKLESIPQDTFNFYTIGAVNRRKNLTALIKAFHLEFGPEEPVSLVIKATQAGMNERENQIKLQEFCDGIKFGLGLYPNPKLYKKEVLITGNLSEDEICRLHMSCNVGVYPSYSEAWGYGAMDSMGFGRAPIVTNWSGFSEFIDDKNGWLVKCNLEPIFGMNEIGVDIYKGSADWAAIDINHLRLCMRQAYEDKGLLEEKGKAGLDRIYDYSYLKVGQQLTEALLNET